MEILKNSWFVGISTGLISGILVSFLLSGLWIKEEK